MEHLQKAPNGLLGAFDLKVTGQNPDQFASLIQPSVDALDFYLLGNRSFVTGSGAWVALGTDIVLAGGVFTVPTDQVWRVKMLSVVVARAAADAALNLEVVVGLQRSGAAAALAIFTPRFEAVPATDLTQARAAVGVQWFLAGPGDKFTLKPRSTMTAAGSALGLSIDFDVMPSG